MDDYDKNIQGDVVNRGIVFVDYSQIDSGLTDESKSFGAICTTDYLLDWKDLSEESTSKKKRMYCRVISLYWKQSTQISKNI